MPLINFIKSEFEKAFNLAGFNVLVTIKHSDRPELSDFQCNDVLSLAKTLKRNPREIANEVLKCLDAEKFEKVSIDGPGFINITLKKSTLEYFISQVKDDKNLGFVKTNNPEKILVDYVGMNIGKIMHIGHLRSSIRGQFYMNLGRYMGHTMIGDAHLGDWGTPMGVIIAEVMERLPNLDYFNPNFKGNYNDIKFPYTCEELISIYPSGSKKNKDNPEFAKKAQECLIKLQKKTPGYYDFWKIMLNVSIQYFKKVTDWLNVYLDYWYGESDAHEAVAELVSELQEKKLLHESLGCQVIDLPQKFNGNTIPPFIVIKSNGTFKYEATDLGTIKNRIKEFNMDRIFYLTDKRQEQYFFSVFNAANNINLYPLERMQFLGHGMMVGPDGKPFKSRAGDAASLQEAIDMVYEASLKSIRESKKDIDEKEIPDIAYKVALAALKFGDLSNYAWNDYVFLPERFTKFSGKTGPYILYAYVRINSILSKNFVNETSNIVITNDTERSLVMKLLEYPEMINYSWNNKTHDTICTYIYELAELFSAFYSISPITSESNEEIKSSRIILIKMCKNAIENFATILGIQLPSKM